MNETSKNNNPAMEIYNRPLGPTDVNYVDLIASYIGGKNNHSDAMIFKNSIDIQNVTKLNQMVQRVVINRYLTNKLLIFRTRSNVNINGILPLLANDGLNEDWLTVVREFVIPFIKDHRVLQLA